MSIATATREGTALKRKSLARWLPWVVLGLGVGLIVVNLTLHESLFHRTAPSSSAGEGGTPGSETSPASPTTVSLTEEKLRAANLSTGESTLEAVPIELGVPGKIEANLDRQVQVRPRASGVVREVKALLGQEVKKGDVLAVIDSPDVGTARLNLRARQRALAAVRFEARFKAEIARNVADLIPRLRANAELPEIERAYAGKTLGAFRSTLLGTYARFAVARHEEEKTSGLFQRQIVGEHPMVVATHTREAAQAEFESAVEQARFDANQDDLLASQKVKQAEAEVVDAAQRLRILGVPEDVPALLEESQDLATPDPSALEDVTAYQVVAPFDGRLIAKSAVPSQRAQPDDVLFTLADLSTVWVMANVPESDFARLPALESGTVRLDATAYPGRSFTARVLSVSATVDPTTRTVAMLAETPNPEGLLKLGMFVRITLDTAGESESVTVPSSAVVEIEGREGVFVPAGSDGRTFSFRPLTF
ncbi:MAG: efflux RND transporter periplasmic adaptor subunit, partial [Isosphaeraceae bacterium]